MKKIIKFINYLRGGLRIKERDDDFKKSKYTEMFFVSLLTKAGGECFEYQTGLAIEPEDSEERTINSVYVIVNSVLKRYFFEKYKGDKNKVEEKCNKYFINSNL